MSQAQRSESTNDVLSLDGLEPLLTAAHVSLVEPVELAETNYGRSLEHESETQLLLSLMNQVDAVNELLMETSYKLQRAHDMILSMEQEISHQEIKLSAMNELEQKYTEVSAWLDAALAENSSLKRPWWKKLLLLN